MAQMQPETIITQLNSQDDGEASAAVQSLIILCMDAMNINVQIPALNFDADWHITNTSFWENIESRIVPNQGVLVDMGASLTRLDFIKIIFTQAEGIQNISQYWLKISVFLSDMASRNDDSLIYFAASASFVIISRLINIRNAATNNDIKQSLSLCIGCIDRMMVLTAKERNSIYRDLSFNLDLEFLSIIQSKSILLTPNTTNIFKKNLWYKGLLTTTTLEITHKFLKSRKSADKRSIFEFYNEQESKSALERIIVESTVPGMKKAIQLTIDLVNYSKKNDLAFECSWALILKHVFSSKSTIKNLSMKLLITKFRGVTEYSVLEIALQVYRQMNEDIVGAITFIDTFEPYEDFNDKTKLFQLLRNSLNDFKKFTDIVSVLRASVKKYNTDAEEYVERFSSTMTDLFEVINLIQNKPKMLCYVTTVVDIEKFRNERGFEDNFTVLQTTLTNLILNHYHRYDITILLCRRLKKLSPSLDDIDEIYKKTYSDCLRANEANDKGSIKVTCTRFLAGDDVFKFFEKINPVDKRNIYDAFKRWFGRNNNSEIKALLCSMIVNMLISYYSITEIPSMSKKYIKDEAEMYRRHINGGILEANANPLVKIFLCTAFCRLHTSIQVLPIESQVINKVYSILSTCIKDDNGAKERSNFIPIACLLYELTELLSKRNYITETPHSLVLLWNDMTNVCVYNIRLKILINHIWNYGADHMFFVDTMQKALYKINAFSKSKQLVDKVLPLMKHDHGLNEVESVALLIVLKLIQRAHNNPRVKIPFLEKIIEHLDTKYITSREMVIRYLHETLNMADIEVRPIMQKFLTYFTDKSNSTTSTNITTTRKRKETTTNIATTTTTTADGPADGELSSRIKRPRRSSIPSINLTINTNDVTPL